MLRNTFCHVSGISATREQQLWAMGLHSWDDAAVKQWEGKSRHKTKVLEEVARSEDRLRAGDAAYFRDRLPSKHHWRLFPQFRSSMAYLDIETTGLGAPGDHVTTIALYDGHRIRQYVHGQNLQEFEKDVSEYQVLVTYNGKCFDMPFIQASMGLKLRQAHIDLRFVLRSLGYRGGLKGCERQLGLHRGDLEGMDGFLAVLLWREYRRHQNAAALETLLAYNIQDVLSLECLLVHAYNQNIQKTPFAASHQMALPSQPQCGFQPDRRLILQRYSFFRASRCREILAARFRTW